MSYLTNNLGFDFFQYIFGKIKITGCLYPNSVNPLSHRDAFLSL